MTPLLSLCIGAVLAAFMAALVSVAWWVDALHRELQSQRRELERHEAAIATGRHIVYDDDAD